MGMKLLKILAVLGCLVCATVTSHADSVKLHAIQFPERSTVSLPLLGTSIAPDAQVSTEIEYRKGQAQIELSYVGMKPAILFGGDITCYVLWAVTRDGQAENLGEFLTSKKNGRLKFSTGKKNFALLVTAESFYLVGKPSKLVLFENVKPAAGAATSTTFDFDDLQPAPRHNMDAISHLKWDSKVPLELLQARKAYELAGRVDAQDHATKAYAEAGRELSLANRIATSAPKSTELLDSARRSVALSNEAMNISMNRLQALEDERKLAERRAETEALERRAAEAEAAAVEARVLAEEVRAEKRRTLADTEALRQEKTSLEAAMIAMRQEKSAILGESRRLSGENSSLEAETARLASETAALAAEAEHLRTERATLEREAQRLQGERDELRGRLQSALSHVADTQDSARGYVVNLPDILFDLNEETLKPEARIVMAKLSGILLMLPDKDVTIEGHTDSTGTAEYNLDLSRRRAVSVMDFVQTQGVDTDRLRAVGYGMQRPVAENASRDGRKRNRRVEIVISDKSRD